MVLRDIITMCGTRTLDRRSIYLKILRMISRLLQLQASAFLSFMCARPTKLVDSPHDYDLATVLFAHLSPVTRRNTVLSLIDTVSTP